MEIDHYNPKVGVPLKQYLSDNMGLIYHVIRRYKGFDQDDLFQEAAIQFIKCYMRYDADNKSGFANYAIQSMSGQVLNYLKRSNNVIKFPDYVSVVHKVARMNDLDEKDIDKLVELSKVKKEHVEDAMKNFVDGKILWMDADFSSQDNDGSTNYHNLSYEYDDYHSTHIHDFLDTLDYRDRQIVLMYADKYTQKEIGERFGVSKTTIGIRRKAIKEKARIFFGGGYYETISS